jgi:hypothetical protein
MAAMAPTTTIVVHIGYQDIKGKIGKQTKGRGGPITTMATFPCEFFFHNFAQPLNSKDLSMFKFGFQRNCT